MKFWDSSAIVPLLLEQEATALSLKLLREDQEAPVVWWGTVAECTSALCRVEREGVIDAKIFEQATNSLKTLTKVWHEIQPSRILRDRAIRLMRLHPLRTADAFQLAAALVATEDLTSPIPFVCFDLRLSDAAKREGFSVLEVE